MKLIRLSVAALLAFAVGATVPAFAQHDHDGDSRHERDKDDDSGHGRGRGHRDARERHEDRGREARERHEDHEWREHERHEARERHEAFERHEGREWREHEWREHERERHTHYVTYVEHHRHYIPEDHFYTRFGYDHRFVIVRPVIVEGRPRFRYGGYWFVIGRPLPPAWRYDDEVYVDFIDDGYYMCSPRHPGIHISVDIL
jgi:hypothetical protein